MGGNGKKQETVVRFAPYLENYHKRLLADVFSIYDEASVASPYDGYADLNFDSALFGSGYAISSFPSLYDMYGKFMAGLDVEVLFDEHFTDLISGGVVANLISQESGILEDELENNAIPRFQTGMRDMNAVMSSTFIAGKAMMEAERIKALSRFSADIRGKLLPIVVERWKSHLQWSKDVIDTYAQIMKFAVIVKMDVDNHNLEVRSKDVLWPFNAIQYITAAVSATAGATNTSSDLAGASRAAKGIGGALSGMAAGAQIGSVIPGIGTGVGAAVGGLVGLVGGLFG